MFDQKDPRNWFSQKRFGMFVHWGLYAVHGLHEQEIWRYHVPPKKYYLCINEFNPVKFDPVKWLDMIQENGMEYLVFTAKHHDGFCMWDTAETDFNIMNTPYRRDILGMLAEECHKRSFPLEIYYSCVDWHHPNYPNIGRHHEIKTDPAKHDFAAYMDFLKRQIRELCTNYGTIHGIWWDMNVPQHQDIEIAEMIHRLQPAAVINNRGYGPGDYSTPERDFQSDGYLPFSDLTEACDSVGMNSWGYRKDEDYFSLRKLERQIALYTSLGGNFLLNAGPMVDGTFPKESTDILHGVGDWYKRVCSALRATPCYGIVSSQDVLATGSNHILNLIFLNPPSGETFILKGLDILPESAVMLNTGDSVQFTLDHMVYTLGEPAALRLRKLPADRMGGEVPVIQLKFKDPVIHGQSVSRLNQDSSKADL